jgi:hypothetical protein
MRFSSSLAAVLAAILITISGTSALALPAAQALYTETYAEGVWRYDYTLFNLADQARFDIFDVFLRFDPARPLAAVSSPAGWESTGWVSMDIATSFIEWFSPSPETDLQPGEGLSGLSVASLFQIGSLSFEVLFTNPGGEPLPWEGITAPMICVPEPESMLLLVFGLVSLALLSRFLPGHSGRR